MPAPDESKLIIIREYLHKYQSAGSTAISAMLVRDYPAVFASVEQTRDIIRYYRGTGGEEKRRKLDPKSYIPRIIVPEPVSVQLEPFELSYSDCPAIIGSDAHFPYHDGDAVEMFFEQAYAIKAKTIILLGDWMDMYQVSAFIKDPRAMRIPEEIAMMRDFLKQVRSRFPKAKIVYKIGNHEDRLETFIKLRAPELFGLENVALDNLLELKQNNIIFVPSRQMIKLGDLFLLHGHETGKSISAPVNPARGLYLKTKVSAICGHYHQSSEHSEKSMNDKIKTCWSIGCLCGLKPDYAPVNKWNHGFAEVYAEDDMYTVVNRKIINYRMV